eukprot:12907162-Prorocentrum_lima.AAC.1
MECGLELPEPCALCQDSHTSCRTRQGRRIVLPNAGRSPPFLHAPHGSPGQDEINALHQAPQPGKCLARRPRGA